MFPRTSFIGNGFRSYNINLAERSITPMDCVSRLEMTSQNTLIINLVGGAEPGAVNSSIFALELVFQDLKGQFWLCCVLQGSLVENISSKYLTHVFLGICSFNEKLKLKTAHEFSPLN